ncbi:MAG: extracellular solute-binding protein, partial [Thermoleophilia bacterium]|nr:extracellular solute-binding protein [Thermoleophilia bacterium]
VVQPDTEKIVAYLIPAICVPKGNPKGIRSLDDLAKPGVRVGFARPDTVCVGLYGAEILERQGLAEQVKKNITVYAESCEKTAALVALGQVDAVMGWDVFAAWEPDKVAAVPLQPSQIPRIGYIPAAVSTFTTAKDLARQFVDYLASDQGRQIFARYGYITDQARAQEMAPQASVGGDYELKTEW